MREILYKAKRLDNGKWIEGYYFCMQHTDNRHDHHFIIPLGCDLSKKRTIRDIQIEVDPVTIGQFVGKLDLDGVKAFEGDIISPNGYEGQSKIYGTIKFESLDPYSKTDIGFWVEWEPDESGRYWRNDLGYWLLKSRVVGNAHDVM